MLLESRLVTARDGWGARFRTGSEFLDTYQVIVGRDKRIVDSPIVLARVNHGRWIADCPFCTGSEMAWFEQPSLFICFSCRNKAVSGHLLRVVIPKNYLKIEDILMIRHPVNRNWEGETLSALKSENTKVGIA